MIESVTASEVQPAPTGGGASPLIVHRIRDLEALEPWLAAWDDLAERAEPRRPMCSGSWTAAWLEVPPRPGLCWEVALARRGDRLVGVWPLVRTRRVPRWLAPPSDLQTFTGGPLIAPGEDARTVLEALLAGGWALRAQRVSALGLVEGDPLHTLLATVHLERWQPMVRRARFRGARLDTAVPFETPWTYLSSKTRQRLKLARRRLGERGTLAHHVDEGEAARTSMATFLELEASTWKGRDTSAIATDARTAAFYRAWARRLADRGWLQLDWTTLDGRPVAAEAAVRFAGTLFVQKITYAEDVARESPGHVRWAETVAWCCGRDDVHAIDTIGCDDIRLRWGCQPYEYVHVHFIRRGLLGFLTTRLPMALRDRVARWRHGDGHADGGAPDEAPGTPEHVP